MMDKTTYTYKTVESGQRLEADVYYCFPRSTSPASPAPIGKPEAFPPTTVTRRSSNSDQLS
jgi:hypothetical protein